MKDGRFYLRLTSDERRMLDEVAERIGLGGNASAAVRFMLREKHRELGLGLDKPRTATPKKKRK